MADMSIAGGFAPVSNKEIHGCLGENALRVYKANWK